MPPARQTLELLRDVLRLLSNFVREVGEIEKEHDFNFSDLQNVLSGPDSTAFFSSLMELDPRIRLSFLRVIAKYTTLSK
jgi:hypothetical protein